MKGGGERFMKLKNRKTDKIWTEHESYIRRLCSYKLESRPEYIDDCVQKIFLALSEALHNEKRIDCPKAWLTKVAYNKISDIYEKIKKEDELFAPFNPDVIDETYSLSVRIDTDKERETELVMNRVLVSLDSDERKLLCDRYELEKSISEIACESGITENAVYQRLYRLKIKTKMLAKDCFDE